MIPDVLLQSNPVVVNIDFKFEFIVFRKVRFQFMSTNTFLLKRGDEGIGIDSIVSKGVVNTVLALDHSEGELYFPAFWNGG